MSALLSCHNIEKSYSSVSLFKNFSLHIHPKDRFGLIGPNGAGKSTFARILSKNEDPDSGVISYQKNLRIRYVSQQNTYNKDDRIYDVISKRLKVFGEKRIDYEIEKVTSQLEILDLEQKVGTLSGGMLKKIELAASLIGQSELIIFDEPTNHLDLRSILWFEDILKMASFAWVCISHDRYFLEKLSTNIVEINSIYPDKYFLSQGSYSAFVSQKNHYLSEQSNLKDSLRSKLKKEKEWVSRSPKARSTKARFRVEQFENLESTYDHISKRMLEDKYDFSFSKSSSKTKKLVEVVDLSLVIGKRVLVQKTPLIMGPGQKIALLGLNGSGKSSFIKAIQGFFPLETGKIILAEGLKIVHFDQEKSDFQKSQNLKDYLCEQGDSVVYRNHQIHVHSWAKRFGFGLSQLDNPIEKLSGGEKARALIAKLILQPADILLLDEPTNDLDIATLEVLEDALKTFPGCLVLISHDRFLVDNVCNHFIGIDQNSHLNSYISQENWQQSIIVDKKKLQKKVAQEKKISSSSSKKLSYMEQREYDGMQKTIEDVETKINLLKKEVDEASQKNDHVILTSLSLELDQLLKKLDALYVRWDELEKKSSGL